MTQNVGVRPSAAGFESDRLRRDWIGLGVVLALFLFVGGLGRIWLSVAVADHGSQVHQLEQRIETLRVDLSIATDELARRRAYADIAESAAAIGFERVEQAHWVPLREEAPAPAGVFDQLATDLRRGSQLILTEALAGERSWEPGRADRR